MRREDPRSGRIGASWYAGAGARLLWLRDDNRPDRDGPRPIGDEPARSGTEPPPTEDPARSAVGGGSVADPARSGLVPPPIPTADGGPSGGWAGSAGPWTPSTMPTGLRRSSRMRRNGSSGDDFTDGRRWQAPSRLRLPTRTGPVRRAPAPGPALKTAEKRKRRRLQSGRFGKPALIYLA